MTTSKSLVIKCFTAPWCLRQLIFDQSAKWVGLICVKKRFGLFISTHKRLEKVLTSLSNSLSIMLLQTCLLGCELVRLQMTNHDSSSIRMVKPQPCIRTGGVL